MRRCSQTERQAQSQASGGRRTFSGPIPPATMANTVVILEKKFLQAARLSLITNGSFEETNEFRIPDSEIVVKLRPHANAAKAVINLIAEVVLVEPAGDIIPVSTEVANVSFLGAIRSKNSLIISANQSDVSLYSTTQRMISFMLEANNCPWKKSFLNLIPDKLADVIVRVNNKDIPTTIAILSAKSDVFKAMFAHNTKEKQTGIVEIEDFSFLVVQEMIRFLMHDYCTHWDGHYEELEAIADKYNIVGMKELAGKKKQLLDKHT